MRVFGNYVMVVVGIYIFALFDKFVPAWLLVTLLCVFFFTFVYFVVDYHPACGAHSTIITPHQS